MVLVMLMLLLLAVLLDVVERLGRDQSVDRTLFLVMMRLMRITVWMRWQIELQTAGGLTQHDMASWSAQRSARRHILVLLMLVVLCLLHFHASDTALSWRGLVLLDSAIVASR